jgi:hypothetical protein
MQKIQKPGGDLMAKNEKKMEKVIGTNCYNCKFVALQEMAVDPKDLNEEGGIDPKNKDETERAKKADLITLPGGPNQMQRQSGTVIMNK